MPYVITTREHTRDTPVNGWPVSLRRAVATLDEARDVCAEQIPEPDTFAQHDALQAQIAALTEHGGTVGPLPDGTMIEVKQVTTDALMGHVRMREGGVPLTEVIDAYNAAQD